MLPVRQYRSNLLLLYRAMRVFLLRQVNMCESNPPYSAQRTPRRTPNPEGNTGREPQATHDEHEEYEEQVNYTNYTKAGVGFITLVVRCSLPVQGFQHYISFCCHRGVPPPHHSAAFYSAGFHYCAMSYKGQVPPRSRSLQYGISLQSDVRKGRGCTTVPQCPRAVGPGKYAVPRKCGQNHFSQVRTAPLVLPQYR